MLWKLKYAVYASLKSPSKILLKTKNARMAGQVGASHCASDYRKVKGFDLYSHNQQRHIKYQRKLRETEKHQEYEKQYRKLYCASFSGVATSLLSNARDRAKRDKLEINIDRQWVVEHLSPMKCEATGVELILIIR